MIQDLQLKLKSSPCQIKYIQSFVNDLMGQCQISQDVYDNILISLTEAVNNAIIHGNKANSNKVVIINCKEQPKKQKLVIQISDEGQGFDPHHIKDPLSPENIECCGGRGVFIMRQLSDELQFKDEGRTVELHFKTA